MKPKTTREVIDVLKDVLHSAHNSAYFFSCCQNPHGIACLKRAIAIVRLWQADITRADVRAAERKRKGRAK